MLLASGADLRAGAGEKLATAARIGPGWTVVDPGEGAGWQGADERPPPELRGDALLVEKLESASALVYWTPDGLGWYQQGD